MRAIHDFPQVAPQLAALKKTLVFTIKARQSTWELLEDTLDLGRVGLLQGVQEVLLLVLDRGRKEKNTQNARDTHHEC